MKEIKLENFCMGASTPGVVQSTKVVVECLAKMTSWMVGNGTEVKKTKEEV